MLLVIGKNGFISKNLQSYQFNNKAIFTSIEDINKYDNGIYNISSNIPISMEEICKIFENKLGRAMEYVLENHEIIRSQTLLNEKLLKCFNLKSLNKNEILKQISEIYV